MRYSKQRELVLQKVEQLCDAAISQKSGFGKLKDDLDNLFDQEIGYMPAKQVHMLGAEYTRWSSPTAYATRKSMYRSPVSPITLTASTSPWRFPTTVSTTPTSICCWMR